MSPDTGRDRGVYGSEVKALAKRYLEPMIGDLQTRARRGRGPGTLTETIVLIIPQAGEQADDR
ncbi:MAG: hypothetical protein OXH75_21350 [Acidobacteria bacterium]|nr:hypothetical protein [Acidobacteriota bacterium]